MKQKYNCTFCNQVFERYSSTVNNPNLVFCCKSHRYEWQKTRLKGENNPNFNRKWTLDQKNNQSKLVQEKMKDPEVKFKAGSANRGKKFSQERINKCHKNRSKESYVRNFTDETKRKIGEKSKTKFTSEFKLKQRKIQEQKQNWIPLDQKSEYEIYKIESNWIDQMWNQITNEDQLNSLKELKVFHSSTNKNGVVRDHVYSRVSGFQEKVFPEILRHPCNCQILTAAENISKGSSNWITLKELFSRIKNYSGSWKEHSLVLIKVQDYEQGKKWSNSYAKNFL